MSTHVERMIEESEELSKKVAALNTFIEKNPIYETLSYDERVDMKDQLYGMADYLFFLKRRILRAKGVT